MRSQFSQADWNACMRNRLELPEAWRYSAISYDGKFVFVRGGRPPSRGYHMEITGQNTGSGSALNCGNTRFRTYRIPVPGGPHCHFVPEPARKSTPSSANLQC